MPKSSLNAKSREQEDDLSDAQWREIAQKSVGVLKGMGSEIEWRCIAT